MPNVLVIGGTGYLGLAVCQALVRSGNYTVWGTARSSENAKKLALYEINPIQLSDIGEEGKLGSLITANAIDVVVDVSTAWEHSPRILAEVVAAGKSRNANLAKVNAIGPKLGFVFTSGTWVYGSPSTRASDLSPVGNQYAAAKPPTVFESRPLREQEVLAAREHVNVAILRPGNIYGGSSPDWSSFWDHMMVAKRPGMKGIPIEMPADPDAVTALVHVEDAAAAFVLTIDKLEGLLGNWPVFDIVAESVPLFDILEESKIAFGVTSLIKYVGPGSDIMLQAMSLISNSDVGNRARIVLGWVPRRKSFLRDMRTFVRAWQADQSERWPELKQQETW